MPTPFAPLADLPPAAGIGLRAPHHRQMLEQGPVAGWLEVHSENFFAAGGAAPALLDRLRADYPISLHGVGLSLGAAEGAMDSYDGRFATHLAKLKSLADRIAPAAISEHLCWGAAGGRHFNDLLPLPYTEEALAVVCRRVMQTQETLGRPILVENVSSYLQFRASTIPEWEFVAAVAQRTGCGILLDVNNIYVSAINHGFDARQYLRAMPPAAVGEIHLAGHARWDGLLIDTHGAPVCDAVWSLYAEALALVGPKPTLIEWDTDIPALDVLLGEAGKAQHLLEQGRVRAA